MTAGAESRSEKLASALEHIRSTWPGDSRRVYELVDRLAKSTDASGIRWVAITAVLGWSSSRVADEIRHDPNKATEAANEAMEVCESIGFEEGAAYSQFFTGYAAERLELIDDAVRAYEAAYARG